jgi:hypothetical protein
VPPDELSPASKNELPPIAPPLIIGAAKGGLAGLFLSVIPLLLAFSNRSHPPLGELALFTLGFVFAGAGACGVDAASARLDARRKRGTLRFLAGTLLPIGAVAPQFGITSQLAWQGANVSGFLLGLAVLALCLGVGFVLAGEPDAPAHRPQGCGRLGIVVAGAALAEVVPLLVFAVAGQVPDGCAIVGASAFAGLVVAFAFWVAQVMAGPFVRPLAAWLEPGSLLDDARSSSVAGAELGRAQGALRLRRFSAAMRALDVAEGDASARQLEEGLIPLRRAEVLLGLGEIDKAEAQAPWAKDAPAIHAEVARRRGDPEKAARLAQEWLDSITGHDTGDAWSVRGSAHGIIALARADQGRFEEAAAALASARTVHGIFPRSFDHLTVPRVADYIEACRERSHPA